MARDLHCPSVPTQPDSLVIGIVQRDGGTPRATMLRRAVRFAEVAHLIPEPLLATDVLRLAAPCAGGGCRHFADQRCSLATRVVQTLPASAERPPPCALRPVCRWWNQEGIAACRRCPGITTQPLAPPPAMSDLATPRHHP